MLRSWNVRPAIALALLGALCAGPLLAQDPEDVEDDAESSPRVERLRFPGADRLDPRELRASIATEATRCRSLLLRPFCWLTDWDAFVEKHHLDRDELERDEIRLVVRYFRRGYREVETRSEVRPHGEGVEVLFHIEEREPTVIESLELLEAEPRLTGTQKRRAGLPGPGEPLDLIRLDTATARLRTMLAEEGYLDAEVRDAITVEEGRRAGFVEIRVEPGRRATVGGLDVRGNRGVAGRTIRDATLLRPGRVLRHGDLEAARRRLHESNLFYESAVEVPPQPDSAKRVVIEVREAPPRAAQGAIGFNTVEFAQVEGGFDHYDWLGGGRQLKVQATVGNLLARQFNDTGVFRDVLPRDREFADDDAFLRPTWTASVELQQPAFLSIGNTLSGAVFGHRRSTPRVAIDEGFGANLSFTRRLRPRTTASLAYRFEMTEIEAGELYFCVSFGVCELPTVDALRQRQRLAPVGVSFTTDRTDHPISATSGWRASVELEHAGSVTSSQFRYHRASGSATLHLPFDGGRRVLAGRVRAGWVGPLDGTTAALGLEGDFDELIHPRKRFYAGGSRSVRGFGENQLGPRVLTVSPAALTDPGLDEPCTTAQLTDGSCDPNIAPRSAFDPRPSGGTAVVEMNVEYRFPLWRELGGAVFVDGAVVRGEQTGARAPVGLDGRGGEPDPEGLLDRTFHAITPGVGVRYDTRIGPIRADVGVRLTGAERLPVVTEVTDEEGRRRLVRLQTPMLFEATEDASLLGRISRRLRLHLSIGEAF